MTRGRNAESLKNLEKGTKFSSKIQPTPQAKSEGRRRQIAEDNTIKAICNAFSQSQTPEKVMKAFEELGFEADTKIKALIAKAISLAMSKNAQLKDVLAMIQFLAKYTGQEPASKSMLVDDEEKGINPFKEFYEAICGEKDYTR
jgi:hypothetical protein